MKKLIGLCAFLSLVGCGVDGPPVRPDPSNTAPAAGDEGAPLPK